MGANSSTTIEQVQRQLDLIFRLLTSHTRGWEVDEAAEILGFSRASIYREIADGKLRPIKRRGSTFIQHEELVRYNGGHDPLSEIVPFLREVMNHIRCPLLNHPTCPMRDVLSRPEKY